MDLVVQTDNFPKLGETVLGTLYSTVPGGKGANQAVAAARLGDNVNMIACIGNDGFGTELIENLKVNNVKVGGVKVSTTSASGIANILISDGDNRIIVVPGANYELEAIDLDALKEMIQQSSIVIMQLEIPIPTIRHALVICEELSVPVLLNPAPAAGFEAAFMSQLAYLTPNETECEQLFGADLDAALELNPNKLIVTLGSEGARYYDGCQHVFVKGYSTTVVDTTGAGDTFNGAFAYAIVNGYEMKNAVQFANAAASLSVEKFGAQGGMPTLDAVNERLGCERL